jgi:signal-transduction protein with cAMP-binding, CBS, and nucleotidyltransferase domain
VWYLSYRHGVPLPNPAQDLYLFDGASTALASQTSSADVRRALVGVPLFAETSDDVLDTLAAASSIERFQQGEVVIAADAAGDLCLLDDGSARLVLHADDAAPLDVLDHASGEVLGLLGELPDVERWAVVVATSDCRIVRIPADAAADAVAASGQLAAVLEQLRASRRRRCERVLRRPPPPAVDPVRPDDDAPRGAFTRPGEMP